MSSSFSMRDTGTRLLLQGRTRLAASMLGRAVAADPSDPEARHNLALALRAQGEVVAALSHAEAAVQHAATPEGLALLGSLRLHRGDVQGAEAALRAALAHPLPEPRRAALEDALQALASGRQPSLTVAVFGAPADAPPLTAQQIAERVAEASCVVALTGSGLTDPTRRHLWAQLHRDASLGVWRLQENPVYLWSVLSGALDGAEAQPSAAHRALSALPVSAVLTQGIDGLHQQAGSPEVIELHGALTRTRCDRCGRRYRVPVQGYLGGPLPPRCVCGGPIRPDVVLFGEEASPASVQSARRWLESADLVLVVDCATDVAPASGLLRHAAAGGGIVRLPGAAEESLPAVLAALRQIGRLG